MSGDGSRDEYRSNENDSIAEPDDDSGSLPGVSRRQALVGGLATAASVGLWAVADSLHSSGAVDDVDAAGDTITIETDSYRMIIHRDGFRFGFERSDAPDIDPHPDHGLSVDDQPAAHVERQSTDDGDTLRFDVATTAGDQVTVTLAFRENAVRVGLAPDRQSAVDLQVGGMAPAFGLGDEAYDAEGPNLAGETVTVSSQNSDGAKRFLSTFAVFPSHCFGGAVFWPYATDIGLTARGYSIQPTAVTGEANAYYFLGSLEEVYGEYKHARTQEGFPGVPPKARALDLGFETWDLLGWTADQAITRGAAEQWLDHGYPLSWLVTGSGFWAEGGTTTSFGRFNDEEWPNPAQFGDFTDERDIDWLIGLRTTFVTEESTEYDEGPFTDELLEGGYELETQDGEPFVGGFDTWQPGGPNYLLDGERDGAADWYLSLYDEWGVDGVKEDTGMSHPKVDVYNAPIRAIAKAGDVSMARCGAWSMPGTIHRSNDIFEASNMARVARVFLAYGASAVPNNYTDSVGFGSMDDPRGALRHGWLEATTAGISVSDTPWWHEWSDDDRAAFKKLIDWRLALTPYFFDAAVRSHTSGYPFTCTPLPIAYPDDERTHDLPSEAGIYEWLIGDSLLASPPMYAPSTDDDDSESDRTDVYLPAGEWMSFESGTRHEGEQLLEDVRMPTTRPPVFVGGSGVVIERTEGHPDRVTWEQGQRERIVLPATSGWDTQESDARLQVRIYPVARADETVSFTVPSGESIAIEKHHDGWNVGSISVQDGANDPVDFYVASRTDAIVFPVRPGETYRLTGG